jgi:hypothetical protein
MNRKQGNDWGRGPRVAQDVERVPAMGTGNDRDLEISNVEFRSAGGFQRPMRHDVQGIRPSRCSVGRGSDRNLKVYQSVHDQVFLKMVPETGAAWRDRVPAIR